jgi:hypothetical protein
VSVEIWLAQLFCGCKADAAIATGNECNFPFKLTHLFSPWLSFVLTDPKDSNVLHVLVDPSDRRNVSAVNDKFASGDGRGSVGNEEGNQFCDFIRSAGATERNPTQ